MRLDTIVKIERFIQDVLLSSPQIPLGVNIVRLAADYDTEGIAAMAYSITVRYVGSSTVELQSVPLSTQRTYNFELTHAAQSYLTQSGHDYALQMCAGAEMSLAGKVPLNVGLTVDVPFFMSSEQFQGLTDSSHYVYTQTWSLVVQDIYPVTSIDPCVWGGNCSFLFPQCAVSEVLPGDVLYGNVLYSPVLPPPVGADYEPQWCGVVQRGKDLVYKADESQVFLYDWTKYKLVSTEKFDSSKEFLIVSIYDENDKFVRQDYFANCDCRRVIQIAGSIPSFGDSNWITGLYTSALGEPGNPLASNGPETLQPVMQAKNGYGYVYLDRTFVWEDPRDPNSNRASVRFGRVYRTLSGVTMEYEGQEYYLIGGTPIGKAWIRTQDFKLIEYDPHAVCEGDTIDPNAEDGNGPGSGTLPPC
jgi:hypothetical protein